MAREVSDKHKRALDQIEWYEHMAGPEDSTPLEIVLVATDTTASELAVVRCANREEAETAILILEEDKDTIVQVATIEYTGRGLIEDRFERADREMGDPNP